MSEYTKHMAMESREQGFGAVPSSARAFVAADLVGFAAGIDEGARFAYQSIASNLREQNSPPHVGMSPDAYYAACAIDALARAIESIPCPASS